MSQLKYLDALAYAHSRRGDKSKDQVYNDAKKRLPPLEPCQYEKAVTQIAQILGL